MKNLFIYSGISLVVLANIAYTTIDIVREVENSVKSKKELISSKINKVSFENSINLSAKKVAKTFTSDKLFLRSVPKSMECKTIGGDLPIEVISTIMINKTADQLIADDNLITEHNISNETQALDFEIINSITEGSEIVEPITVIKKEKTVDQLISEDNLITESNISNQTQALDFEMINNITEGFEIVEPITVTKKEKTADQLISEDNLITESNISNETQTLDFEKINNSTEGFEIVEPITVIEKEKTADQLIAEDNLITESNITNESQALDFEMINRNLVTDTNEQLYSNKLK